MNPSEPGETFDLSSTIYLRPSLLRFWFWWLALFAAAADIKLGAAETGDKEFSLQGMRKWRYYLQLMKARVDHARH